MWGGGKESIEAMRDFDSLVFAERLVGLNIMLTES